MERSAGTRCGSVTLSRRGWPVLICLASCALALAIHALPAEQSTQRHAQQDPFAHHAWQDDAEQELMQNAKSALNSFSLVFVDHSVAGVKGKDLPSEPARGSRMVHLIENGVPRTAFLETCMVSGSYSTSHDARMSCAYVDEYTTQVDLIALFNPSLYSMPKPDIKVVSLQKHAGNSSAKARSEVDDVKIGIKYFSANHDAGTSMFSIVFDCGIQRGNNSEQLATLTFSFDDEVHVSISILKKCATSFQMMHPDLLVSLESNAMTNAKPNTRVELTPGSDILFELLTDEVVIPEDKGVVINLLVSLKFPGTIHKIGSIVWNRAPPGFEVSIVAMNSLEFIRRGLYSKFPLLATCSSEKLEGVGSSRAFEVSFDMTPFRPLRIRWNMTCAARLQEPKRASVAEMRAQASAMLSANAAKAAVLNASSENSVGRRNDSPDPRIMRDDLAGDKQRELTKRENFSALINVCVFNVVHPEIVQAGKVQKEYNITRANFQLFALRDPRALALPIKWLDPRVSIFEASVWAGLRRTINYSGVYISSSAPDIVMGALVLPSMFSYFYMSESGGSIVDMRKLRVMCVCLDAGSAYVMVSVVLEDGSLIEFGFAKECDSPQMHQRSGQLTAVSLMNWILFCMMAASAGTLAFFVKRQSLSFNMQPSGTRYSESRFSRGPRVGTTGARPVERAGQFDTSCLKDG